MPTKKYFVKAHKQYQNTLVCHLSKEVKKRGAKFLAIDTSYKEAGNLCQHKGNSIFNSLVTGTNEVGEVRIQFHAVSDAHDQYETPLDAFKKTTEEYGLPQPRIVSVDNPISDCNLFLCKFESLRDEKAKFNSNQAPVIGGLPPFPYDPDTPFLKVVEEPSEINLAVSSMMSVMNKDLGVAVDCEHRVQFNGCGTRVKEWKVGLILFAYFIKIQTIKWNPCSYGFTS